MRAALHRYAVSEKGRTVQRRYAISSKGKKTRARYAATPQNRAHQAAHAAAHYVPHPRKVTVNICGHPERRHEARGLCGPCYDATPERRAVKARYNGCPKARARAAMRRATPEYKARQKVYQSSPKARAIHARYKVTYRTKIEGRANKLLYRAQRRAEKKNLPFNLLKYRRQITERLRSGVCEITGMPFVFGGRETPYSPSIDRKKPEKGYVYSNIRIILWGLNAAFNSWGEKVAFRIALAAMRGTREIKTRAITIPDPALFEDDFFLREVNDEQTKTI